MDDKENDVALLNLQDIGGKWCTALCVLRRVLIERILLGERKARLYDYWHRIGRSLEVRKDMKAWLHNRSPVKNIFKGLGG